MTTTRRELVRRGLLAGGGALLAPMLNFGRCRLFANAAPYSARAIDLVEGSLVTDMLGLVTLDWAKQTRWLAEPSSFPAASLQKIQSSGISVFHPAVHFPSGEPKQTARYYLESWNHFLQYQRDHFLRVERAEDFLTAKNSERTGVLLGLQDSEHLVSVDDVNRYHALGQRISQLTYNERSRLGCGCLEPRDSGLTEFGAAVVQRMNETGMAIDVSHCGPRTTLDAFEASRRPVLITHSNCAALVPGQPRCKSDEVLRKMARQGGVIGITAIRSFVRRGGPVHLEQVLDHFEHVARLVGVEYAGIGSDLDVDVGRGEAVLHPTTRIFDLTEGLLRRGFSEDAIRLMLGGNFVRALKDIWGPRPAA